MGWHQQRLDQWRRAAGLLPMPAFLRNYGHIRDYEYAGDAAYIDSRYFSPAALHWADEVEEFRRKRGVLPADAAECFGRVWEAMRKERTPTDAQVKEYEKDRRWKDAIAQIPELYAIEMHSRGVKEYGPDYELPDDVPGPGSPWQLIFKYLYGDLGYSTPGSAKTGFYEWKKTDSGKSAVSKWENMTRRAAGGTA